MSIAKRCGGKLSQVLIVVGADTYPSSEGMDISLEKLRRKHTLRMHMRIADKLAEYINGEFDNLFI